MGRGRGTHPSETPLTQHSTKGLEGGHTDTRSTGVFTGRINIRENPRKEKEREGRRGKTNGMWRVHSTEMN